LKNNNKRLAKNTLALYFRMLLSMVVSLYTVRVVLTTLGVVDYGIYNLVGGIVTSFSFLSATMSSATQRFFSFELGKKDFKRLNQIFSLSISIYLGIILVILILAETLGLWFLNTQLTLPAARMDAVNWIYQFSILTFIMTLIRIPYDAVIIARERMSVYAYMSIVEVILKLLIVYLLVLVSFDKLKLYAVLIFLVTTIVSLIFRIYCKRNFEECNFKLFWDKATFKMLFSYSGWSLFGTLTTVTFDQGTNFLLNIFFGPVVNASRAIAYQVNNAINSFSSNFYTAIRPQIIKSYAEGNRAYVIQLVFRSSKYSLFLLLLISMPVLLDTDFILNFWLKVIPPDTSLFVRLVIIYSLFNALQIPLSTAVQATGNIKMYQIVIGCIMLLCLPISYVCFKVGLPAEYAFYSMILVSLVAIYFRLRILKTLISFSYAEYLNGVLFKILLVCLFAYLLPLYISMQLPLGLLRFIVICFASLFSCVFFIYVVGLVKEEKEFVYNIIKKTYKDKILKNKS
jgi:O-antigen/teichoic acid export membrane protein